MLCTKNCWIEQLTDLLQHILRNTNHIVCAKMDLWKAPIELWRLSKLSLFFVNMKQFDIFDKPLIGLYTKTAQGGLGSATWKCWLLVSLFILAVSVCAAIVTIFIVPAESVETSVRSRNSFLQSTIMSMDIFIQNSLCDGTLKKRVFFIDLEYEFLSPSASVVAPAKNVWEWTLQIVYRLAWSPTYRSKLAESMEIPVLSLYG